MSAMQPNIHINGLAIFASVVASFVIGSLWYGPLFGKTWAQAMGFPTGTKPPTSEIIKGSIINLVGAVLMAYVLAHEVTIWRPSTWNVGQDQGPAVYGFMAAFFAWMGFVVPILLNGVAFEHKSWRIFWIGAAYQFISMQTMGMILSHWT